MNREFDTYHPVINFAFFVVVIMFTLMFMHPVFLVIGLVAAIAYSIYLMGVKAVKFNLFFSLPMMFGIAVLNPFFVHEGMTILFYMNDKPITLESFVYGCATAVMLVTIMVWFSCYNKVMTSEKFIYLFGKVIPAISLILSMALGFIPRFKDKLNEIRNSQRNIGRDINCGSIIQKAKQGLNIISILMTWALENGVNTADSMRARGYGLSGRKSFSMYKFDKRDRLALIYLLFCTVICLIGYFTGRNTMQFYPFIEIKSFGIYETLISITYLGLVFLPLTIEVREGLRWHLLRSKI